MNVVMVWGGGGVCECGDGVGRGGVCERGDGVGRGMW